MISKELLEHITSIRRTDSRENHCPASQAMNSCFDIESG